MAGQFELAMRGAIGQTKEQIEEVITLSLLEFVSRIKIRTPVDTGRLRANWQFGVGSAPRGVLELGVDAKLTAIGGGAGAGRVYFVVNNLPYARRIEFGFIGPDSLGRNYQQAGRKMVALTVMEWPQIVASAVAAVRTKWS